MVGRPKIIRTTEEIKELQKRRRKKYRGYFSTYQKLYHLKKKLADPEYDKKNYRKRKGNSK